MTDQPTMDAEAFGQVLWADADLESLTIDYETVRIVLLESNGQRKTVSCLGYIGFEGIGLWDEAVIESATLYRSHPLIDRCVRSIEERCGKPVPDSGSEARNAGTWVVLSVRLIDGSEINLVAAGLSVATVEQAGEIV